MRESIIQPWMRVETIGLENLPGGFESAGFQVVWTNEFNPEFADMYESAYSTWRKWKHLPGGTKLQSEEHN